MHKQKFARMERLLQAVPSALEPADRAFFVALVAYRFRNNMFHGNKGVQSWLRYRPQIDLCTRALQAFVSHAESLRPTMSTLGVA